MALFSLASHSQQFTQALLRIQWFRMAASTMVPDDGLSCQPE
jgi:hypothetical protein